MRRKILLTSFGFAALVAALGTAGCSHGTSGGADTLRAGGSSFIDPLMQQWITDYGKEKGVKINYQPQGSGFGVSKMTSRDLDIGFTDAPMNPEQLDKARKDGGEVLHIPMVMGGVVPAYNLPDVKKPIVFSGPVLADIYLGKITKWNDPALKELNGDLNLPDLTIQVAHRSDKSGTTFIWTDYLSKVSPEWAKEVGSATAVKWKVGVGQEQNPGVASYVSNTKGAIGYLELIYALSSPNIQFGDVQNKSGKVVRASLESVTAAAAGLKDVPENLCYSLTDGEGSDTYPIVGTTWAVLYEKQPAGKRQAVVDFLRWAIHQGQHTCAELKYARLPERIVKLADQKLDKVHD